MNLFIKHACIVCIAILFPLRTHVAGEVDNNPKDAGKSLGKGAGGAAYEGLMSNPALLGSQRVPRGMIHIFPFTRGGLSYWSDKLEVPLVFDYLNFAIKESNKSLNTLLKDGMGVKGIADSLATKKITTSFHNGANLYGGMKLTLFDFSAGRFAMGLGTEAHGDLHLPEASLVAIAGDTNTKSLNPYDFSTFRLNTLWATTLNGAIGVPLWSTRLNEIIRLPKTAFGVRGGYILGHSYVKSWADTGSKNGLWRIRYQSSGAGLSPDGFKTPINGQGYHVDLGLLFYGEHAGLSFQTENIGAIYWNGDVAEGTDTLTDANLRSNTLLPRQNRDSSDRPGFTTRLPTSIGAGYSYQWDAPIKGAAVMHYLAHYVYGAATCRYVFYDYPGTRAGTVATTGIASGMFYGAMPLRLGWSFGGMEGKTSAAGLGFEFRNHALDLCYKSIGSLAFNARKGFEISIGYTMVWGVERDWDNDWVLDKNDKCEGPREDRDGFQDNDGCPDPDNDKDGIADLVDKCPNKAEDRDGFEDRDGCPDIDNDKDGIADSVDKCSNQAEDRDGFQDNDGCPDADNDRDGIPDSVDKCPNQAEDLDGCQDNDGCPDPDNDRDGIPDSVDRCPDRAENMNGFQDSDGCPDTIPVSAPPRIQTSDTVRLIPVEQPPAQPVPDSPKPVRIDVPILFGYQSSAISEYYQSVLDFIAQLLKKNDRLMFEIKGYSNDAGSDRTNLLLSVSRAAKVRDYLASQGVPASRLAIAGYGKESPAGFNDTEKGRRANRRVVFEQITSQEQFEALRKKETEQKISDQ